MEQLGTILLIHGFHRTGEAMLHMADDLRKRGYRVLVPTLPTTRERIPVCVQRLQEFLMHNPLGEGPVHLVGHSYGGLILRGLLARQEIPNLVSLTCMGSSHHGTRLADVLCHAPWYRRESAIQEFRTPGPLIAAPLQGWPKVVHLIAGSRNALLWGRLLLPKESDGRLPIASALANTPGGLDCGFPSWTSRTIVPLDHHELMDHTLATDAVVAGFCTFVQ